MFFAVLENVAGSVVVRARSAAQAGANSHEVLLWSGEAASYEEALHFAAQTDARIDLLWMRGGSDQIEQRLRRSNMVRRRFFQDSLIAVAGQSGVADPV